MRRIIGLAWIVLAVVSWLPRTAASAEPWADERLAFRDGLVLWLDAVRQDRAYAAHNLPAVAPGGELGIWFDGSGKGVRLVQRSRGSSPRLLVAGGRATVLFDGKDDHLQLTGSGPGLDLDEFTVFVFAAAASNPGQYPGLLAVNAVGRRDYQSGFNLDLGPRPTERFESLNLEGKGFAGASDLMNDAFPLGTYHTIEARAGSGAGGVALWLDGRPQGRRNRQGGPIHVDEITLGARYYNNAGVPNFVQGFFDGAIAEVLLYNRALSDSEALLVREYLSRKYAVLPKSLAPQAAGKGQPEYRVADPPPVQVLVPGFAVRALPVKLTNINNLKYRHDGKLVALAYNGSIYLLSDRDGDGLEEHVTTFWDNPSRIRSPIGMDLLPAGDPRGNGVLVSSKSKCSLIVDSDGDDKADREIIVAEGWPELKHNVGALGVALAEDGSVYFGTGTASFTEAYLLDASGRSHYDLKSELGTILRVAPDFQSRSIVATGIRYPVALRFNRGGDLFATDQEGATWLPNGNPFDELLQIQQGRHYGFPPRHSRHLPGVIDEPSVFDYKPQHQSTCGLNFNESVLGGPEFGPPSWAGDALVSGYSRGKLFRTKLVKTAAGYVAHTALLAVLNKLTVDACVSPNGALAVATHSGGPDWGSGPTGQGTLYKIAYTQRDQPQPVLAWAASPREVRVAFDRPLDPGSLRDLARGTTLALGRSASAGDRFETLRPGYAVVMVQLGDPRKNLAIHSVQMSPDRRSLILATDPQAEAVTYALTLPGLGRPPRGPKDGAELPQEPAIDLAYGLTGVDGEWRSESGAVLWRGWLPHLDLAVANVLTAGSTEHEQLWSLLGRPGSLRLTTRLDLRSLLRPTVQPGSQVDDTLPSERATLTLTASGPLSVTIGAETSASTTQASSGDPFVTVPITLPPALAEPVPLEIVLTNRSDQPPRLIVSYHTNEDDRPHPAATGSIHPTLAHRRRGKVSTGGTDLARGAGRRELGGGPRPVLWPGGTLRPSVMRFGAGGGRSAPTCRTWCTATIRRCSATSASRAFRSTRTTSPTAWHWSTAVSSGTVRSAGTSLRVGDSQGRETVLAQSDVEAMQPQPISTMPEGLVQVLGAAKLKNLLTFLLAPELRPAPIRREGARPLPRTRAEVEAVVKVAKPAGDQKVRPLQIVLVSGPKDHGVDEHDYPLFQDRWSALLDRAEGVTVTTTNGWPTTDDFARADVLVMFSANPGWTAEKGPQLDAYLERGGGMVLLHYAVNGQKAPEELARRIGLAWQGGLSKFRHGPLDLAFTAAAHPITAGFRNLHLVDETYWQLVGNTADVEVLATAVEDGSPRPLLWTRQAGKGRVFCSIPGHYNWTFDDPLFRTLILRGIAWTASVPADRFVDLATRGARIAGETETAP